MQRTPPETNKIFANFKLKIFCNWISFVAFATESAEFGDTAEFSDMWERWFVYINLYAAACKFWSILCVERTKDQLICIFTKKCLLSEIFHRACI